MVSSSWEKLGKPSSFILTQPSFQHRPQLRRRIPCGGPFYQRGPHRDQLIGLDRRQTLEEGCHPEEDQREQMNKDVVDLLAVGDEFKNRPSIVHLLSSHFQPNKAPAIINSKTNWFNYVDAYYILISCMIVKLLFAYKIWLSWRLLIETSVIYINDQYICRIPQRELSLERSSRIKD